MGASRAGGLFPAAPHRATWPCLGSTLLTGQAAPWWGTSHVPRCRSPSGSPNWSQRGLTEALQLLRSQGFPIPHGMQKPPDSGNSLARRGTTLTPSCSRRESSASSPCGGAGR